MTDAQRQQLFTVLADWLDDQFLTEAVGEILGSKFGIVHRELSALITDDLDRLEPFIDDYITQAELRGRFEVYLEWASWLQDIHGHGIYRDVVPPIKTIERKSE